MWYTPGMRQTPLRIVACLDVRHHASQDVIAGVLRTPRNT